MKTKLFNFTVYAMLGWSIVSAGYMALPPDIQAMIPQFNWLTAVISGGSTLLLGTGGLAVQTWLAKAKTSSTAKYNELGNLFLTLTQKYNEVTAKYDEIKTSTDYTNKLIATELQTKLSNPMLDDTARQLIMQVLTHDGQE